MLLGAGLVAGPVVASVLGHGLGGGVATIMVVSGIVLIALSAILLLITRLYRKTKSSEAFVRTGMGGMRVVMDGGALVIPVIHEVIGVSLETFKLQVERNGPNALITQDKLRADIGAEFFVKVPPDEQNIMNAARSLGMKGVQHDAVKKLVEDKLVSALRSVAAKKTLEELNSDRESFIEEVTKFITQDLEQNGLKLETVTISQLDQTDPGTLKDNNIFDAQGKRTIAEITQEQLTKRNQLERDGEKARKDQDVQTKKAVLMMEQDQANAEAKQKAEIAKVAADQQREAQEKQIEAQRQVELAGVQKQQTVEVASKQKEQMVEVAERKKAEAVEVAEQEKELAVAQAEQAKALAEKEKSEAESQREKARQDVETVKVIETAERQKKQQEIDASAKAEQEYIKNQREADAKAYQVKVDAQARREAADADAEAVRKKAEAARDAQVAEAAGQRAVQMVPVDVSQKQVEVDRDRVDTVLKPELEARERSGQVAQDFEIAKLQVEADKQVRVEMAKATATFGQKVNMELLGTPEQAAELWRRLMTGMGTAKLVDGFINAAGPETLATAKSVVSAATGLMTAGAKRLAGEANGHPTAEAKPTDGDST